MSSNEVKHSTLTSGELSSLLEHVFKDAPELSFIAEAEEKPSEKKKLKSNRSSTDYFDTTLEREVYQEVKSFQSMVASHSILSSIDETETVLLTSTAGENTVRRFDKALLEESLSQNDSTVIFNATSHDHSTDSWLMDELTNKTVELGKAEDSKRSKEDDDEVTLEDSFLQ